MKSKRLSFCLIALIFPIVMYSQADDFGVWYKLNAEFSLNKKLSVDMSTVVRTFNNASEIEQAFLEAGLSYDINKYIAIAGAYRFTENLEDDSKYHIRHKWFADIKGKSDIGRFSISGRFRFQRQDKTYIEDANDEIPDYHGRLKLKSTYKTKSFPVNPYISYETFFRMFETTNKRFDKYRFAVGAEYKINKIHSIETDYTFERDFFPHLEDMHIITVGYNLKF